jgi:hypothetical protein
MFTVICLEYDEANGESVATSVASGFTTEQEAIEAACAAVVEPLSPGDYEASVYEGDPSDRGDLVYVGAAVVSAGAVFIRREDK